MNVSKQYKVFLNVPGLEILTDILINKGGFLGGKTDFLEGKADFLEGKADFVGGKVDFLAGKSRIP
jgi:hypothetical protein